MIFDSIKGKLEGPALAALPKDATTVDAIIVAIQIISAFSKFQVFLSIFNHVFKRDLIKWFLNMFN